MSASSKAKRKAALLADRPRLRSIGLIYAREMRDQLRDRRTLFTIVVLPMLLYPIVGMLLMQIAQFTRAHTTSVCVLGVERVAATSDEANWAGTMPPLLREADDDDATPVREASTYEFVPDVVSTDEHLRLYGYRTGELGDPKKVRDRARQWVRDGVFDCVVAIEDNFRLDVDVEVPTETIELYYNVASDPSMVARDRIERILNRWRGGWVRDRLQDAGVELSVLNPFEIEGVDIAPERTRETAFWSKILPFIMLVWAMTGAFYPAIDLVAGEKERGTLETLLCSPALRGEIVWGKLGAVMSFSVLTATLNACSMLMTSTLVFHQMGIGPGGAAMGTPPLAPMAWLLVALIPLSALFSALALAVAAMARSSKEGQYYLMPLMMLTLPLVMLPMLPGTTLGIGTSLIPVTGMFLLVRSLIEGQFWDAIAHLPIVTMVTGTCLVLATRWARRQFESESVLFGDGDQWELGAWVRHLWRDRQRAATPALGLGCGLIVLVALFFGKLAVRELPQDFSGLTKVIMLPQIGLILAPTLLMATMMTTSLKSSLRIHWPSWRVWSVVPVLALALHPLHIQLAGWVNTLYPMSPQALEAMTPFAEQISNASWLSVIFLLAIVPAVCEELTFRGFVFGGLARGSSPLRAILVTSIMFGVSHGVLQQSITASIVGVVLGWVALRTGSVLPGMLIHFTLNGMSVSMERIANLDRPVLNDIIYNGMDGAQYHPVYSAVSVAVVIACLMSLHRATRSGTGINPLDAISDRLVGSARLADPSTAT
ncbi:MAG: ABC transporter permease subunit/CPBP intramembrane protease [Planctomycetota bacterium]